MQQIVVHGSHPGSRYRGGAHGSIGRPPVIARWRPRGSTEGIDFGEFVKQRSAALFRTAFLVTGCRETAEDVVQEALEKAYRRWQRICAADSPEAYLRRMVVNLAIDGWHRRQRAGEPVELVDRPADGDPFALADLRDELATALLALPIRMRTAVVLHYLHDMDDRQIADLLDISPGTVRSQLSRALAKLREAHRSPGRPLAPLDREGV
ncbi:SigE family RNA polymerase sigma factor [Kitasatospora sp. NPDC058965]|uniref:SigE family RNA polymerase sigma factor n=1 Tax=Kitasatospora sp. NPDC058965 TaxID=3346682 RepID=UPI0036A9FF7A